MKTFAIYLNGKNIDVYRAWSQEGAVNAFIEDYPMCSGFNISTMELYIP